MSSNADHIGTFWEHLDELRSCLIRIAIAVIGFAFFIFFFKDDLFRIVLAPKSSDFVTYRLIHVSAFDIHLMNIGLLTPVLYVCLPPQKYLLTEKGLEVLKQ